MYFRLRSIAIFIIFITANIPTIYVGTIAQASDEKSCIISERIDEWVDLDKKPFDHDAFRRAQKAFKAFRRDFEDVITWKSFAPDKGKDETEREHAKKYKEQAEELMSEFENAISGAEDVYRDLIIKVLNVRVKACETCRAVTYYEDYAEKVSRARIKLRKDRPELITLTDFKEIELQDSRIRRMVRDMENKADAFKNARDDNDDDEIEEVRRDLRRMWVKLIDLRKPFENEKSPLLRDIAKQFNCRKKS